MNHALQGTAFAEKIQVFPAVESTNTYAVQQAQKGALHGSVYIAEEQTAGRGRGAHTWHSEPFAGLYVSFILRPQMAPSDALWLSLATGLAVQAAVENVTAMAPDIRWPNDLLFENRKFGGILTEMNADNDRVRYAVVGIGMNVNHGQFPEELRGLATSLRLESGRLTALNELAIAILQSLDVELKRLMQPETFAQTTASILKRLEKKSSWIRGKRVSVSEGGGYTGVTAGLDQLGFLRVATDAGTRTVLSGGVREAKG